MRHPRSHASCIYDLNLENTLVISGRVYKAMNNHALDYMIDLLKFSENKTYNLRSKSNKSQIKPNTNYYKDSFPYTSFSIWNTIPTHTRRILMQCIKDAVK